jgi:hypothetical protein
MSTESNPQAVTGVYYDDNLKAVVIDVTRINTLDGNLLFEKAILLARSNPAAEALSRECEVIVGLPSE